ncbi:MAG: hypothetical protein JW987_05220 [Anaerolineaceae bacterium]|nr:hypothetical protein [Anaerolineaceae bacterium]
MKNADLLQSQKEHILSELHQVRIEIISAVQQLLPIQRSEIFLGTWSVEDCLAHLVGWDYTNIEAAKAIQNGLLPEFYAHRDKDWQGYNAILVNKYKLKDWDELIASVHTSRRLLNDYFEQLPVETFFKDWGVRYKGYKVIISRLLEADTKDVRMHLQQINSYFFERI